jgi:hypothetical protein
VGIERVQVCTERTLCQVQGEEYQRKTLIEIVEHSVENSARCALRRGRQEGTEVFFEEILRSELRNPLQGVQIKSSKDQAQKR